MNTFFAFVLLLCQHQVSGGYTVSGDNLVFAFTGDVKEAVYVSGNFNQWAKTEEAWKMKFDAASGAWRLEVPRSKIKKTGQGFYEFTFRVDGKLIDADRGYHNTIHCAGYGYRYVIRDL